MGTILVTSRTRDVLAELPRRADDRLDDAAELLDRLVLDDEFAEFLTIDAYRVLSRLDRGDQRAG